VLVLQWYREVLVCTGACAYEVLRCTGAWCVEVQRCMVCSGVEVLRCTGAEVNRCREVGYN